MAVAERALVFAESETNWWRLVPPAGCIDLQSWYPSRALALAQCRVRGWAVLEEEEVPVGAPGPEEAVA